MPNPWDSIPLEKWRKLLAIAVDMHDVDPSDLADEDDSFTAEDKKALDLWAAEVLEEVRSEARAAGTLPKSTRLFMESLMNDMDPVERAKAGSEFDVIKDNVRVVAKK